METVAGSVTENGYIGLSVKFSLIVKVGTALAAAPGRLPKNGNTTESVQSPRYRRSEMTNQQVLPMPLSTDAEPTLPISSSSLSISSPCLYTGGPPHPPMKSPGTHLDTYLVYATLNNTVTYCYS
jgi:hypothetical protein